MEVTKMVIWGDEQLNSCMSDWTKIVNLSHTPLLIGKHIPSIQGWPSPVVSGQKSIIPRQQDGAEKDFHQMAGESEDESNVGFGISPLI